MLVHGSTRTFMWKCAGKVVLLIAKHMSRHNSPARRRATSRSNSADAEMPATQADAQPPMATTQTRSSKRADARPQEAHPLQTRGRRADALRPGPTPQTQRHDARAQTRGVPR